ncbi:hypothetical protein GEMRC1_004114 [Eukaryota sp. GEM-RC1]
MSWPTIESDPGVFTELLQRMGVSGLKVEELYSLDEATITALPHCFGLIFLYKWAPGEQDYRPTIRPIDEGLYFARQMVSNTCATQALINIIMNIPEDRIGADKPGSHHVIFSDQLLEFKHTTFLYDADAKGVAISNSPFLLEAHRSFERPSPMVTDTSAAGKEDDVFHFIAYLPHRNKVYELDGLSKHGPVVLDDVPENNWASIAVPYIQERISKFSQREIRFSVLAVVADPREECQSIISDLEKQIEELERDPDLNKDQLLSLRSKRARLIDFVQSEDRLFDKWKIDNIRRRHDYTPFLAKLLETLAKRNELLPAIEQAKKGK